MSKNAYIHATSIIDENADLGNGTKIWHFCHVCAGAKIGENCNIGQNCYVGKNAVIGNNCKIQNNVSVYEGVELSDYVFCGPSMVFTNDLTPRCMFPKYGGYKKTIVGFGATLGANSTIVCGNKIGKFALVGAGAVVTRDIPDYAVAIGNPAKVIGYACKCGAKLVCGDDSIKCQTCDRKYKRDGENLCCAEDEA